MVRTPTELERLTIFSAAELARKRRVRCPRLDHAAAVAFIADELLESACDGRSVAELMSFGSTLQKEDDVLPRVAVMTQILQVESIFPDGTKLVTVHDQIRPRKGGEAGGVIPGELIVAEGEDIEFNAGRPTISLFVVNTAAGQYKSTRIIISSRPTAGSEAMQVAIGGYAACREAYRGTKSHRRESWHSCPISRQKSGQDDEE